MSKINDLTPEEMIGALLEGMKDVKMGLIKFEIKTTPEATEMGGYKSKFYKELEKDFPKEDKEQIENAIKEVNKKMLELQKILSEAINNLD